MQFAQLCCSLLSNGHEETKFGQHAPYRLDSLPIAILTDSEWFNSETAFRFNAEGAPDPSEIRTNPRSFRLRDWFAGIES
jgi:hypothetical protein